MKVNILLDAALAFPISGAHAVECPANYAPNNITKRAIKTFPG
jgi:hypothetical protein